jgi:hypothetical protein
MSLSGRPCISVSLPWALSFSYTARTEATDMVILQFLSLIDTEPCRLAASFCERERAPRGRLSALAEARG